MKINFVLPGLGDSGGIRVVKHYTKLFNDMGIDTVIYSPIIADNLHRYNSCIINIVHQLYCTGKTIIERDRKAENTIWVPSIHDRYIRKADYSIATTYATAYKVAKLSNNSGKKWYFVQDFEIWDNYSLGLGSYQLPLKKIVISTWINNQLIDNLGMGPFPVVCNGIDTSIFNNANRTRHEGITFLMLNHTLKKKGVKEGLEVYRRIQKKYPNTTLRMFGMCSNDNIPKEIDYYRNPSKEELISLYKDTDIFLYPSLQEGWGLTPIEAMSCGCAVAGTRTGFALDLGQHGRNMMISEPGDVDGMVENVEILINNPKMIYELSQTALNDVSNLDWKVSCEKFIKCLNDYVED